MENLFSHLKIEDVHRLKNKLNGSPPRRKHAEHAPPVVDIDDDNGVENGGDVEAGEGNDAVNSEDAGNDEVTIEYADDDDEADGNRDEGEEAAQPVEADSNSSSSVDVDGGGQPMQENRGNLSYPRHAQAAPKVVQWSPQGQGWVVGSGGAPRVPPMGNVYNGSASMPQLQSIAEPQPQLLPSLRSPSYPQLQQPHMLPTIVPPTTPVK